MNKLADIVCALLCTLYCVHDISAYHKIFCILLWSNSGIVISKVGSAYIYIYIYYKYAVYKPVSVLHI